MKNIKIEDEKWNLRLKTRNEDEKRIKIENQKQN
jgi:hypothetical protein